MRLVPVISKFAYTTNDIGQRETLVTTGSAFNTAPAYTWAYNPTGELTQADDTSAANNDNLYEYDAIRNRVSWSVGVSPTAANNAYTTNALNQYTAVGSFNPTHDDDGNQLTAQIFPVESPAPVPAIFHWDAENRLIKITDPTETTTIVEYAYDYIGRRISEQATISSLTTTTRWIYDGWNMLTEYTGTTLSKRYLWGMDLSGSMQGAGGVGGLLSVNEGTATYYPTYDGNGNVSAYLDSTGAVQAHYEYDPFGRTTVATGAKAQDFAHRFSTKPLDEETGLYYYGYRYYDPVTGRWPSRDPIEEAGGMNLYGFVGNDGLNWVDYLGKDRQTGGGTDYFGAEGPGFFDPIGGLTGFSGEDQSRLNAAISAAEAITDSEGRKCYLIILRTAPLNGDGVRAAVETSDRVILAGHTNRQGFHTGGDVVPYSDLPGSEGTSGNCSIHGCYQDSSGSVSQLGSAHLAIREIEALEEKDCCENIESIFVGSGTL